MSQMDLPVEPPEKSKYVSTLENTSPKYAITQ